MRGLVSKTIDWFVHPSYSDSHIGDWIAFVAVVLIVAYLWNTQVVHKLTEG